MSENSYRITELVVLIAGVVLPNLWSVIRLAGLLRDFPPHRHIGRVILYPKGYNPNEPKSRVDGD